MSRSGAGDAEAEPTGDTVTSVTPVPHSPNLSAGASRPGRAVAFRRLVGGVVLTGALLAVGCGGDGSSAVADGDTAPSGSRSGGEAPLDAEAADAINLRVVADGSQVALADVAATDRPTLLWFWAPF